MALSVLSIGNFDGVHLGHQAIVRMLRDAAEAWTSADRPRVKVITFDPHPATVLKPGSRRMRLASIDQRRQKLAEAGVDEVVVLEPTPRLLAMSPTAFVDQIVCEHKPMLLVEGGDFRFGKDRAGDVATLAELGRSRGFDVRVAPTVEVQLTDHQCAVVSSTLVRWLVQRGRVADAAACLGRVYDLAGKVTAGEQVGRTLGYPTANITLPDGVMAPGDGVYGGWAINEAGERYVAAVSVGVRPTFGRRRRLIEAHLRGFNGELYGQRLRVELCRWIRDQRPFASPRALGEQLRRDVARIEAMAETGQLAPVAMDESHAAMQQGGSAAQPAGEGMR